MKKYRLILLLMLALGLALSSYAAAAENAAKKGARDLVFEDEEVEKNAEKGPGADAVPPIKDGEKISITTSVELTRDGKTDIVAPNSTFKSGDKVRFIYTPGMDGHIYWLARMTSGKYTVLFPTSKTGKDNLVKKGEKYTMPFKGAFRFDDKVGTEIIMCVISQERIGELDKIIDEADKAGGQVDLNANKIDALADLNFNKRKTRDLVFEEEEDEKSLTKTQTAKAGEPFVAIYELIHE